MPSVVPYSDEIENLEIVIVLSRYYFEDDDLNDEGRHWSSRVNF